MERRIKLENTQQAQILFGRHDENLKLIEKETGATLINRLDELIIRGETDCVEKASNILQKALEIIRSKGEIQKQDIHLLARGIKKEVIMKDELLESIDVSLKGKHVGPKTKGQLEYVRAIRNYDMVFAIGPAGTGKTYLAMAVAIEALKKGYVRRIILTRPAIEAGESLGFLPGDISQKISPYLRPLYDALYDMMEAERIEKYLSMGIIEVAPLAYMRGRTLNDAFIILDEAQNCTPEQMKMFLTRLGFNSKAVITGDITQSDLPGGKPLGLLQSKQLLEGIDGIKFVYFSGEDIVRHELVQKIIKAYERLDKDKR
jgi:phosphate starvation-inducible PhoH-like protein